MSKVIILRGLPGSGKSTWIKRQSTLIFHVFSADQFFMTGPSDNPYKFDPAKIGEAHALCFRDFVEHARGKPSADLIVDNTNIRGWEMAPYIQAANAYGLEYEIITIWEAPAVCAQRNIHDVPFTVIMSMYQALLSEVLPPFWKHRIV